MVHILRILSTLPPKKTTQAYDKTFCKCRCTNSEAKSRCAQERARKFWDERNCQCLCRTEEFRECSTGFVYDAVDTCRCSKTMNGNATTTTNRRRKRRPVVKRPLP